MKAKRYGGAASPKESTIVAAIVKALRGRGCWVTKLHGGPTQQAGLPDLLAVYAGRAMFFEVKRPGGEVTRLQSHTLDELKSAGAAARVVCSAAEAVAFFDMFSQPINDATNE